MQFPQFGWRDATAVRVAPKTRLCDQCRASLGDKTVLTRDAAGVTRRFCPDDICITNWRQGHSSQFRRA